MRHLSERYAVHQTAERARVGRQTHVSDFRWYLAPGWHVSCILPIIDSSLNRIPLVIPVSSKSDWHETGNNSHDWNALNSATKNFLGSLIRLVLAVLLVGVLAFLYIMSQPGELRHQPQVATYLRQLREVDGRWNADLATARKDPLSVETGPKEDVLRLQPVLDGLQSETAAMKIRALDFGVAGLRQTFLQKQQMVDKFDAGQYGPAQRTAQRGGSDHSGSSDCQLNLLNRSPRCA